MTTKTQMFKIVRTYCIGCSGNSVGEVRRCHLTHCLLWPYRMGKDPDLEKKTEFFSKDAGGYLGSSETRVVENTAVGGGFQP